MGPASAVMLEIRMLARIDVASRARMELLVLLRLVSSAGRWTARSACSIKYVFIVLAPMKSHLDVTRLGDPIPCALGV